MNLGAYRSYSEQDVLQGLFCLTGATGSKGTIVSIVGNALATGYNPANPDGFGNMIQPSYPNTYSARYVCNSTVGPTPSGANTQPIGMQLYDVLELNPWNEMLLFRPEERAERQAVLSGQPVPLATAGTFSLLGAQGTISGGALGVVRGGLVYGVPAVPVPSGDTVVGTFLGTTGRDGSALFRLAINNI